MSWTHLVCCSFSKFTTERAPFIVLHLEGSNVSVYDQVLPAPTTTMSQSIRQFDEYVFNHFTMKNVRWCLVVASANDIIDNLRVACADESITLGAYFDRYFDLVMEFNKFAPEFKVTNTKDMCNALGISLKDNLSPIDHCKIMSNILASIIKEGHSFGEPMCMAALSDSIARRPLLGSNSTSVFKPRGLVTATSAAAVAAAVSSIVPSSTPTQGSRAVRLRGLPWEATEDQVREFYHPLTLDSVTFTYNHRGKPTGEAYIMFETVSEASESFSRDKGQLGSRYVEMFPITEHQLWEKVKKAGRKEKRSQKKGGSGKGPSTSGSSAASSGSNGSNGGVAEDTENAWVGAGEGYVTPVVAMFGLPFEVTVQDVERFFADFSFIPGSVDVETDFTGKAIGTGRVVFITPAEATRAQKALNKKYIGKRYINLKLVKRNK